jgi:hypothetical protein|tara:strand:- start:48 stop:329 length:282 start_codon:yes stop_codon:yes gene_type:complete
MLNWFVLAIIYTAVSPDTPQLAVNTFNIFKSEEVCKATLQVNREVILGTIVDHYPNNKKIQLICIDHISLQKLKENYDKQFKYSSYTNRYTFY